MHTRNNRRQLHRIIQIPKVVIWLGGYPDKISRKDYQKLEKKHPAWLDDILVITKGTKEQQNVR